MIHFRCIFFFIGWLLIILSGAMIIPLVMEYTLGNQETAPYFLSAIISLFSGGLLVFSNKSDREVSFGKRDTFLLTTLSWVTLIAFSTLPFLFSSLPISLTDAIFEGVSGMTTTGATVLSELSTMPVGILVWRAMLEWLGAVGIVVMALTIMAELKIGGLELFQSESSDKSEKLMPRIRQMTKIIFLTYVCLTFVCFLILLTLGLPFLDAFCHTLTCVSTGGFANYDASIGHYNSLLIEGTMGLFMVIGGCTQLLFARAWMGRGLQFFQDQQIQTYLKALALFVMSLIVWRLLVTSEDPLTVIIKSFFNITSVMTTTGYSSEDYSAWGPFAMVFFFMLPFFGGCTGSTSGGIKVFRFQVLWSIALVQLKKLRRPHGVFLPSYNGKKISDTIFQSVVGFVLLFLLSFMGLALILGMQGLDFMTALSASCSMITNLGPGLGKVIGPAGNYASFSDNIKWCLMAGMILGRLELLTIFVLFLPSFWKD